MTERPSSENRPHEQRNQPPTPEEKMAFLEERNRELEQENVQLKERIERLEKLATHDELTELLNRRALPEEAAHLFAAEEDEVREERRETEKRKHRCGAVLIIDIDNFKNVNDNFGHDAGDQVLKAVATFLQGSVRKKDIVGRWGGEEFVIVFDGATAQDIVNKFYQKTNGRAELTFTMKINEGTPKEQELTITFSGGVADIIPGETLESAVERADELLYDAKVDGKNRILKAEEKRIR